MRTAVASLASGSDGDNEDWYSASPHLFVVLDGATARTGTGCSHGIAWYAAHLGAALSEGASDSTLPLQQVLSAGIERVAGLHSWCDLSHSGTPSAAVAMVRIQDDGWTEYLVLGDVSVVLDSTYGIKTVSDDRVSQTATAERRAADEYPIGTALKNEAMIRMKHAELAMRNRPGGYWIAAADPAAADQATVGRVATGDVRRFAVLTDGAARIVVPFGEMTWDELLDLAEKHGPEAVLRKVRAAEASDPLGQRWPRNKRSDDATLALAVNESGE
ncbi:protein phosphatase 2C domain-containing protein [Actinoplanes hulinensis]|uniref:Protein phosphatase 2C domain-containing protein n=1 Tax=Actinoplanes hulinensis TaxID=1144547 RepID=A0ABS7AVW2_9ACTN|nr:protein phosphatase 2C domain-containing protein [Actinoplanes hulinensis]MBW6432724.1 protein phosphatase 2C domain-containing protein [Actinoplanes hulinensis]